MFVTTNTLGNNYHHVNYYANTPKRKILIQAHTPKIDWSKALPNQYGEYAYLRYDSEQKLRELVTIFQHNSLYSMTSNALVARKVIK